MKYRIAINGYGRIGQSLLRAVYERRAAKEGSDESIEIVAINELSDIDTIAYLTRYDTTHGRFPLPVSVESDREINISSDTISVSRCTDAAELPWLEQGIDLVMECTGAYNTYEDLFRHVEAGAAKVLVSQPGASDFDRTVVYGVNHDSVISSDQIVSSASCTSNAAVPLLDALHRHFDIQAGTLTTIHSAMNDQPTIDAYHHHDLRRTRSSMNNVVPVDTGLAKGVERILPALKGKLTATAMRVPTVNVSAIELCVYVACNTDIAQVNKVLREQADNDQYGVLHYTEEPLASSDFIHQAYSSVVDGSQTRVSGGKLIKILTWFDNEWGYANRMLDLANHWLSK
jgi:D-erythrose 4-phosphate dehydrogenase